MTWRAGDPGGNVPAGVADRRSYGAFTALAEEPLVEGCRPHDYGNRNREPQSYLSSQDGNPGGPDPPG